MRTIFIAALAACLTACSQSSSTDTIAVASPAKSDETAAWDLPLPLPVGTTAEISETDLATRIKTIADDAFEGRGPGTPAGEKAAEWIAADMERIGLQPGGDNGSWFQKVEMVNQTLLVDGSDLQFFAPDGTEIPSELKKDDIFWTKHQDQTSLTLDPSDVIFVGYGAVAPEYDWNDYGSADYSGKTVIMLVNDPGFATGDPDLFKGRAMTYYGRWTYKFEEAARQGADAAIVIHETAPASYGWDVVSNSWSGAQSDLVRSNGGSDRTILEGWVTRELADKLFESAGLSLDELKTAAKMPGFSPVPLEGVKASGTISQTVEQLESRNVIGILPGETAPDEYMLYTAHWDHLGKKTGEKTGAPGEDFYSDQIFNGAVDNATGVAALLELAEAMAEKPRARSTMFLSVTLEESGLLGSAYFAENPTVPLNRIVAGVNIDGALPIGRTKEMMVVGHGSSQLEDLLETALNTQGREMLPEARPEAGTYYRSDHISLAKKGVPMLYADGGENKVDGGIAAGKAAARAYNEQRYHKPMDEYADDWDLSGFAEDIQALFSVGEAIADGSDWPTWYEGAEFEGVRKASLEAQD